MPQVYRVPREVLKMTQRHCAQAAGRGVEGLVFWTGTPDGEVRHCVIPPQSATAVFVTADANAVAQMLLDCADREEILLAQVHSHLGPAFHSSVDDKGIVCQDPSFWSLVVADGGRGGNLAENQGFRVYEHTGRQVWREVSGSELQARLIILEDMYDRSAVFARGVGAAGGRPLRLLVSLSHELAATTNGQMMLVHALNLLPRLSERYIAIDVVMPPGTVCRLPASGGTSLDSVALTQLYDIQPYGTYRVLSAPKGEYDAALAIGRALLRGVRTTFVNSDGWVAWAGGSPDIGRIIGSSANVIGAQGAAALGVARLFAECEGLAAGTDSPDVTFNFFTLESHKEGMANPDVPEDLDCRTVHIIGGGALANSLMQALRYFPSVKGRFIISEPENLDLTNNNRYVLMVYRDGASRLHKLALFKRSWAHHPGVTVETENGAFGHGRDLKADFVITVADRIDPRLEAQRQLPSVLLNSGTNGEMFAVSRHSREAITRSMARCVGCIVGRNDEPDRRQREGTISFVASMAGISLAAVFARELLFPEEAREMDITFSAFGMGWPLHKSGLPPRVDCPLSELHRGGVISVDSSVGI